MKIDNKFVDSKLNILVKEIDQIKILRLLSIRVKK